jgi:hypothetical protein
MASQFAQAAEGIGVIDEDQPVSTSRDQHMAFL